MSEKTSKENLKKSDYDEISAVIERQMQRIASIAGSEGVVESQSLKKKKKKWWKPKVCDRHDL